MTDTEPPPQVRVELVDTKKIRFWQKFAGFINSPALLTLAAFLLTGIVGGYISDMIGDNQHRADLLASQLNARQNRWDAQETVINDAMNDRLADAKIVDSALANGDSDDDIAQSWGKYRESYRYYEVNNNQNASALRIFGGSNMEDGYILDDDRSNAFTSYRDMITSRFALLDGCLTRAHAAYAIRFPGKNGKPASVRTGSPLDILSNCDTTQKDPKERKFSAAAGKLSNCITGFDTELNGIMRLKRGVVEKRILAETDLRRYYNRQAVAREVQSAKNLACANYRLSEERLKDACFDASRPADNPDLTGAIALQCKAPKG